MFGKITIFASGNKSELKDSTKDLVRIFAETVRARIENKGKSTPAAQPKLNPLKVYQWKIKSLS